MALQATPYKVELDISNVDQGIYDSVKIVVARHPSETELRLTARILAYALYYHEHLKFGRGLSDADEPALWQVNLAGVIEHWVDVGQPDPERMLKSSRKAPLCSVVAYGNIRVWADKTLPKIADINNLSIVALPENEHQALSAMAQRNMHWGVMITDNVVYVSDENGQVAMPLAILKEPN